MVMIDLLGRTDILKTLSLPGCVSHGVSPLAWTSTVPFYNPVEFQMLLLGLFPDIWFFLMFL